MPGHYGIGKHENWRLSERRYKTLDEVQGALRSEIEAEALKTVKKKKKRSDRIDEIQKLIDKAAKAGQ
jgi:hypothetical protein